LKTKTFIVFILTPALRSSPRLKGSVNLRLETLFNIKTLQKVFLFIFVSNLNPNDKLKSRLHWSFVYR